MAPAVLISLLILARHGLMAWIDYTYGGFGPSGKSSTK